MKNFKLSLSAFLPVMILFISCTPAKKVEFLYEFNNIPMSLTPPITQGPNTFQAELILNLDSAFASNKADRTKIKDVSVESMELNISGDRTFNNFENVVVNFFSDKNDMTKLASLSPVPKDVQSLKISSSEKADIHKYFSESSMFLIIDANMTTGDTLGYDLSMNMKLKFTALEKK